MGSPKILKLLLVEDSLEDGELVSEAIREMQETPHGPKWHACEMIPADCLQEAIGYLQQDRYDAILLNLSLPDAPTLLDAFARIQSAAGSTPLIVLADEEDENLARTLLRSGAQDVIVKAQLECAPLARSLRYAIERQRRTRALEAASFIDELTGLYNQRGFAAFAERDIQTARSTEMPLLISVVELAGLTEDLDLILVRFAELVRACFGEGAAIARLSDRRFGICTSTLTETGLEHTLEYLEREMKLPFELRAGSATYCAGRPGGLPELLAEAESRLSPKAAMLAH